MNRRHLVVAAPPPACSAPPPGGWSEEVTRWLIQHAARTAPPALAERLEEEWLADLAERHGSMARLRFGIGCCWATRVITHEFAAPKVLAAASATGNKVMNAYLQQDYSLFSRRTLTFVLIIGLHGIMIFALANGLAQRFMQVIPANMTVGMLPTVERHAPPPLPAPNFSHPPLKIPEPESPPQFPPDETTAVNADPIAPLVDRLPPPSAPPHVVNRVLGGPGTAFPATDDFYPPAAIRRGEKGVTTVRTCVDENGRLTATPTIARSSGSSSLDEGALKLAKAGSGHYRPTTEDGRAVSSCYEYLVRFNFRD